MSRQADTHTQTESVMLVFMLRTAPYKKKKYN